MEFNNRMKYGMEWDKNVSDQLEHTGFQVGRYNIETVAPHFTKDKAYNDSDNPSILFARFFPDGVAADFKNNIGFFWDAKRSTTIEKTAYTIYKSISSNGRKLLLFIKNNMDVYCVPIEMIKFKDSKKAVRAFKNPLPVDCEGWIAPRLLPFEEYLIWKKRYPHASGTAYRYFDFAKMDNFKINFPTDLNKLNEFLLIDDGYRPKVYKKKQNCESLIQNSVNLLSFIN